VSDITGQCDAIASAIGFVWSTQRLTHPFVAVLAIVTGFTTPSAVVIVYLDVHANITAAYGSTVAAWKNRLDELASDLRIARILRAGTSIVAV
tara:strand:- start:149 stop:427 length:279 start_codon:yes stop_codon:yes gene_type:complete